MADIIRAVFVVGLALLALLLGGISIAAFAGVWTPSAQHPPDTVVPTIGADDAAILATAGLFTVVGLVLSFRLWLRSSWHVLSVVILTLLSMVPFGWALWLMNWPR